MFEHRQNKMHTCRNCGGLGHLYKDCTEPIMSFGIICFREANCKTSESIEYIMIQRKDSLCFMEFVRGKYDYTNLSYVQSLFSNMTADERTAILTKSFEELWNQVWLQPYIARHNQEFMEAKRKYDALIQRGMRDMLAGTPAFYSEPEWGFPKGRRRMREKDVDCAVREFSEETGFAADDIKLVSCPPLEEIFHGTNNILYKHVYYIAYLQKNHDKQMIVDQNNIHQVREVRKIQWFSFEIAYDLIRSHNQERKALFTDVNTYVHMYFTQRAREERQCHKCQSEQLSANTNTNTTTNITFGLNFGNNEVSNGYYNMWHT